MSVGLYEIAHLLATYYSIEFHNYAVESISYFLLSVLNLMWSNFIGWLQVVAFWEREKKKSSQSTSNPLFSMSFPYEEEMNRFPYEEMLQNRGRSSIA